MHSGARIGLGGDDGCRGNAATTAVRAISALAVSRANAIIRSNAVYLFKESVFRTGKPMLRSGLRCQTCTTGTTMGAQRPSSTHADVRMSCVLAVEEAKTPVSVTYKGPCPSLRPAHSLLAPLQLPIIMYTRRAEGQDARVGDMQEPADLFKEEEPACLRESVSA
eukprot:363824-Chlamydomonas_euryale.AAC.3